MTRLKFAAAAALSMLPTVHAADIYGGPTYDSTTGTGYRSPTLPVRPGASAGNGVGIGTALKTTAGANFGPRPYRWDATGNAAVELGTLGTDVSGNTFSEAFAVNATGTAIGYAYKYTDGMNVGQRAVRWNANGATAIELGAVETAGGSTSSLAYAINATGTVVGYVGKSSLGLRAVRWDTNGVATELGNLGIYGPGSTSSEAYSVNDSGTAVGYAYKYTNNAQLGVRAVRWDAAGTVATELGNLGTNSSGSTDCRAHAVNAAGTAIGYATKYTNGTSLGVRAVRWNANGTAATELGNLGTSSTGSTTSYTHALNATGTAVGYASKYTASHRAVGFRAVRWDAITGDATELGNLGIDSSGTAISQANAINDAGTTVGYAYEYVGGTYTDVRAVAWGLDGAAIDLNKPLSPTDATR